VVSTSKTKANFDSFIFLFSIGELLSGLGINCLGYWVTLQYPDFSTGMSYSQNQIQHKKLEEDIENRFSVQKIEQDAPRRKRRAWYRLQDSISKTFNAIYPIPVFHADSDSVINLYQWRPHSSVIGTYLSALDL